MFWRDIDEGAWEGITATLTAEDVSRRPTWCVDVVYPGRVKMWRKRAREGTLPPVLVYDVSALTMFALLDGHDRYAAARAEGVPA